MFRRRDRRDENGGAGETKEAVKNGRLEGDDERAGSTPAAAGVTTDEADDAEALEDEVLVEDDALVGDEPEDMTADLESQAADYLADNDVWMYGPNAEDILAILDRLEDLTPTEARPIAEAWLAVPKEDRDKARKAQRKILETDLEVLRRYQTAREAIGTWLAVKAAFPEFVAAAEDWPKIAGQASEAAMDACTALILDEKLIEAEYQTLSNPWFEAMDKLRIEADLAKLEGTDEEGEAVEGDEADTDDEEAELQYGPNTDAVTDFLNRLWLLTPEQVSRLVTTWRDVDRDELRDAHENLQSLVDADPEYREQVRKAQAKLGPWLNTTRFEESAGFFGSAGQGESRKMAGPALADAVAALVLGDLLEPEDAETLYWPWFNLIGAPPLPEPAGEAADDQDADNE